LSPAASVASSGQFPAQARGVRVTVSAQRPTFLPRFVGAWQVLVQSTASSTARPTTPPVSATLVAPIAVYVGDVQQAYAVTSTYDLFNPPTLPAGQPPALDFAGAATSPSSGASTYGSLDTNLQYWSDGQHLNGTLQTDGTVALAGSNNFGAVAVGLLDNVRRQALVDASGAPYALVVVPVWSTASATPAPGSVRVVGFAQLKVRRADISSSSARGTFVPYAAAAWGTPTIPSPDIGAVLIRLVS
jgi:hypothetical protein